MAKPARPSRQSSNANQRGDGRGGSPLGIIIICCVFIAGAGLAYLKFGTSPSSGSSTSKSATSLSITNSSAVAINTATVTNLPQMEVKQAVMVTVELDFGAEVPSIAEALQQIERHHQPADGTGRVFSILDAYGEPTADGKKLHMSMHVSLEKLGIGSLIFKRTGKVLWSHRVIPAADGTTSTGPTGLVILLDDGSGRTYTVDGSKNPASILQAILKEPQLPVEQAWPDGAEREVTFIYSGCGCPVKVACRRVGQRTVRTKALPVLFPDDPDAVSVIKGLMGWER